MPRSPDLPGSRTLPDIISGIKKPKPGVDTAWYKVGPSEAHGINFTNSATNWVNSSLAVPISWYLAEDGEIRIRGAVESAVGVMFRLPPEARPEFSQTFICPTEAGSDETDAVIHLDIKFRSYQAPDDTTGV